MTIITVASRGPQGASAWATVGATGAYKPSSYGGDFSLALAACLDANGQADIQPGSYTAQTALSRSTAYEMIRASQGAVVTVGNSSPVGFLSHSGACFQMHGLRVVQSANVNDQVAVHVTGNEPTFRDTIFEVSTASGSTANPMTSLKLGTRTQGINAPMVNGCRFMPNKGSIGLHVAGEPDSGTTTGNGAMIWAHLGTESSTPRKCYKGIWFDSAGEANVDVRAHGLGDGTDPIYALIHATTDSSEAEAHHLRINMNSELITGSHVYRGDGARFTTLNGIIGRCNGNASGEGTIHVTRNTSSGTNAGTFHVGSLEVHNASTSSGRVMVFEYVDRVHLGIVSFGLLNGRAIRLGTNVDTFIATSMSFTGIATGSLIELVATPTRMWVGDTFNSTGAQLYTAIPSGASVFPHGFCEAGASVTAASVAVDSGTTADQLRRNVVW